MLDSPDRKKKLDVMSRYIIATTEYVHCTADGLTNFITLGDFKNFL